MTKIFDARISQVGPEAQDMIPGANMFILFGANAPTDLAEFCFTLDNHVLVREIEVGHHLLLDGQSYLITAVGDVVNKNLSALGHISVSLDGASQASLPGTMHIQVEQAPEIHVGSQVQIVA